MISQLGLGAGGDQGSAGQNFSANTAGTLNPVDLTQTAGLQVQSQQALAQQSAFVNALQAQNGTQNQSNVFNQLGGIANGTGPNPAMSALNQATSANTANQAALMAGQRGAGANTGLIARQAAQQGAANQQQAVGQGATMQAQQSLNALNQQGGIAGQQVGQQAQALQGFTGATQQQQQMLLNAVAAQNQVAASQQANVNSSNAGVADIVAKKQGEGAAGAGGVGGLLGIGSAHGGVIESYADGGAVDTAQEITAPPPTVSGPQSSIGKYFQAQAYSAPGTTTPAPANGAQQIQESQQNTKQKGKNIIEAAKSVYDKGKAIYDYLKPDPYANAPEAEVPTNDQIDADTSTEDVGNSIPQADAASEQATEDAAAPAADDAAGTATAAGEATTGAGELGEIAEVAAAHGGFMKAKSKPVPAMVSPGEIYLAPKQAQAVAAKKANPMQGKHIPGKAKYKGDNLKNDTVPATLEEGGVVIPRTIVNAPDAAKKAAAFVTAHLAARGHMPRKVS